MRHLRLMMNWPNCMNLPNPSATDRMWYISNLIKTDKDNHPNKFKESIIILQVQSIHKHYSYLGAVVNELILQTITRLTFFGHPHTCVLMLKETKFTKCL